MSRLKPIFILLYLCLAIQASAQKALVDSLKSVLSEETSIKNIDLLNNISKGLMYTQPEEAMEYVNKALAQSAEIGYSEGRIMALINRAVIESNAYQLEEAALSLTEAIELSEPLQYHLGQAYARLSLVAVYVRKSDYDSALALSYKSLESARKTQKPDLIVSNLINIGAILQSFNDMEEAKQYFLEGIDIAKDNPEVAKARTGQLQVNLGVIYASEGNYGLAKANYQQALDIFRELNMTNQVAHTLMNLGYCEMSLNHFEAAMQHYQESENLWEKLKNTRNQAFVLKNKGELMAMKGSNAAAIRHYSDALIFLGNQDQKLKSEIQLKISNAYEGVGQARLALAAYKEHVAIQDSLEKLSNENSIAQLKAEYDLDRLQKEAALNNQQIQIQSLKITQRNLVIVVVLIALIVLAVWLRIQRQRLNAELTVTKQQKKIAEQSVALKTIHFEKERSRLLENVDVLTAQNDQLHQKLEENLTSGISGVAPEELFKKLRHAIAYEKDWAAFQLYFDSIYPELIDKLKKNYELEFTQYEQRLISLVKIGFSNKEIADIFNISRNSVVKSKARLRDKVGLDETRALDEMIQNL